MSRPPGLRSRPSAPRRRHRTGWRPTSLATLLLSALRRRVAMIAGLPVAALEATLARTELTAGAVALVRTMRAGGAYAALVSGGFRYFTQRIAACCGFDE